MGPSTVTIELQIFGKRIEKKNGRMHGGNKLAALEN